MSGINPVVVHQSSYGSQTDLQTRSILSTKLNKMNEVLVSDSEISKFHKNIEISRCNLLYLLSKSAKNLKEEVVNSLMLEIDEISNFDDWKEGDIPVSKDSARTFVSLLKKLNPQIPPRITCNCSGRAIMYWVHGNNQIRFECLSKHTVKWYATGRNKGKKFRFWGKNTMSGIIEELKSYEISFEKFISSKV